MSLQSTDLAYLLLAVALLLVAAHVVGRLFEMLRQPAVIGEILGGLLLGPTVLGLVAPHAQAVLFPSKGAVNSGLGVLSELGLLLLMFLSGREALAYRDGGKKNRTIAAVAVSGLAIPFLVGLAAVQFVDYAGFTGPNGNKASFALVFGVGIAVTSIPVISRIMLDLGILRTGFARVTLAVALLEDLALYVALAVILGLVQSKSGTTFGLWSLFHNNSVGASSSYYVVASLVFFAVFLPAGRPLFAWLSRSRFNMIERRSPTAFRLVYLVGLALLCVLLGINPIFGAVLAGVGAAGADQRETDESRRPDIDRAWAAIRRFSLALFIPLYFATVGLELDLVHHFAVLFFLAFLVLACATKSASVWAGARLAGERPRAALHLAVALNARGGPGIVLATVTLAAGVINENFFTILVMLSIVTSEIAGVWLQHTFVPELAAQRKASGSVAVPAADLADDPAEPDADLSEDSAEGSAEDAHTTT